MTIRRTLDERFRLPVALILGAACFLHLGAKTDPGRRDSGRWRLEAAAGWGWLDPDHLNRLARSDRQAQQFLYDRHLEYLRRSGAIASWQLQAKGGPKEIRAALTAGLRLSCRLGRSVSLSAGLDYLRGGGAEGTEAVYTRALTTGERDVETLAYSPYRLAVAAWWPHLGLRVGARPPDKPGIEGFADAGPLLATCSYRSAWTYSWHKLGPNYDWLLFSDEGARQERGSGTGLGLEAGVRLVYPLRRRFDLFLEAAYAYQRVSAISGSGLEKRGASTESWSGEWGLHSETLTAPWGTQTLSYPTGRRSESGSLDPFRLDLSGIRLRAGLSLRL